MTTATVPSFVLSLCENEIKKIVLNCLDVVSKTYHIPKEDLLATVEKELALVLIKPEKAKKPEAEKSDKIKSHHHNIQPIPKTQCRALCKSKKLKGVSQCLRQTTGQYCYEHESSRKHGTVDRLG